MSANMGVRKSSTNMTIMLVTRPDSCVRAPDALLTDDRLKLPVAVYALKAAPKKLATPRPTISLSQRQSAAREHACMRSVSTSMRDCHSTERAAAGACCRTC